jgi:hypothetical protein
MMAVGISSVDIYLPKNHSLKEKRQAIKRIVERTRTRFNISIMEIVPSNLWQRACIGFSVVGADKDHVNSAIEAIHNYIESLYIGKIIDTKIEVIVIGNEI